METVNKISLFLTSNSYRVKNLTHTRRYFIVYGRLTQNQPHSYFLMQSNSLNSSTVTYPQLKFDVLGTVL